MKLYTKNKGSNYLAKVVNLTQIDKHPNADKLAVAIVDHQKVIIGVDAKIGDSYIYFPLECRINHDLLSYTNSFSDPESNSDKKTKGFFSKQGRVKAIRLRGVESEGYLMPLGKLLEWLKLNPEEFYSGDWWGMEFDSIAIGDKDILLCEKYVPPMQYVKGPANQVKKDKTKRFDRLVPDQFRFHVDTAHLKKNLHAIQAKDIITISEKLHGTSFVCANILVNRKLTWKEKLAKFFGVKVQAQEYGIIYSSRSVLKNAYLYEDDKKPNHWYKQDIWGLAKDRIQHALEKGITVYAEIVGQMPNGSWIQKNYDYGCAPNEFEVYVYRITSTNSDGKVVEFTTPQLQRYCQKYGLKHVPIHFYGRAEDYCSYMSEEIGGGVGDLLKDLRDDFLEKSCWMCKNKVPGEGVIISKEAETFTAFKLKSWAFFEQESKALDSGEADIETQESQGESNV